MTLEQQLAIKTIGPVSEPNVAVTRAFLLEILATLRAQDKTIQQLRERVAAQPETPPAFDVVEQINQSEARGDVRVEFARRSVL